MLSAGFFPRISMDIVKVYAVAVGGLFFAIILINFISQRVRERISLFVSKHLTYPYFLRRHRLLGPWTRSGVLLQSTYIAINVFCLSFRVSAVSKAGLRAANLSLINMIPLFASPHLSVLADILGFRLGTYRQIHRSAGLMSSALLLFHLFAVALQKTPFSLKIPAHFYGMIAASSLCLLVLLSHPFFRRPSYEVFLRTHQALAVLSAYSIWRHLPSITLFPRMYVYIPAGLFLSTSVVGCVRVLWRNGISRYGRARAVVTHVDSSVKVSITLSRPLKVEAGQYINLWIPSISFWSFLQSHPFVVASWSPEPQDRLELFVEPRRGLTRDLLYHAQNRQNSATSRSCWVMFSGPHGVSAPVGEYPSILMIASGFGMAALFPYLKKLIYGYQTRKVCTRQIRVIWQVERIETTLAMQTLLNDALKGDNLDKILSISIFSTNLKDAEVSFGRRGTVYRGSADAPRILRDEMNTRRTESAGRDLESAQGKAGNDATGELLGAKERTLVMASTTAQKRDDLRNTVRKYLDDGIEFLELEYQPGEG